MEKNVELFRVEIPNYIRYVTLSKKRRPKYYKKGNKIPKKYQTSKYAYNKKGVLISIESKLPVIANPRVVGLPRIKKINGQDFYTGNNNPFMRSKIILEMKDYFRKEILKHKIQKISTKAYPVELDLEFHNKVDQLNYDMDNTSWVYVKVIQDVLVELGIIESDTIVYLSKTGSAQFVPVEEGNSEKLIIILKKNITPYRSKIKSLLNQEKLVF